MPPTTLAPRPRTRRLPKREPFTEGIPPPSIETYVVTPPPPPTQFPFNLSTATPIKKNRRARWYTLLAIGVIVVGTFVSHLLYLKSHRVIVELWGTATDPKTIEVERSLMFVRDHFGSRVTIAIHLVSTTDAEKIKSIRTTADRAVQDLDVEENIRQTILMNRAPHRFWNYLRLRNDPYVNTDWQSLVGTLNIPPEEMTRNKPQGEATLRDVAQKFIALKKDLPAGTEFPILTINGQPYEGRADALSLAARMARTILRRGRNELPAPRRVSLFKNRINFPLTPTYRINGIPEAFTDADCQDRSDLDGYLIGTNTPWPRCTYTTAPEVVLTVYGDRTNIANLLALLKTDFKKLTLRDATADKAFRKKITQLDLPAKMADLEEEPYLVFDKSVEQSFVFPLYKNADLLIPLPDGAYLFNRLVLAPPTPQK